MTHIEQAEAIMHDTGAELLAIARKLKNGTPTGELKNALAKISAIRDRLGEAIDHLDTKIIKREMSP